MTPPNSCLDMAGDLRAHLSICVEVLAIVERESHHLQEQQSQPNPRLAEARKSLLDRLAPSLDNLRKHRHAWQRLPPEDRARHPEIPVLIRQNQDLIMRIIVLDRENEQTLLRRGQLPARHLPHVNQRRPHFVADLYKRHVS